MNNYFLATRLAAFCGGLQRLSSGLGVLALLLGLGLTTYHPSVQAQAPLTDITQVAAGSDYTCALTTGSRPALAVYEISIAPLSYRARSDPARENAESPRGKHTRPFV